MKKTIGTFVMLFGIILIFIIPALLSGLAFGLISSENIQFFQIIFWGFCVFFVLYLLLGGKAVDFKFWGKKN